MRVEEFVPCEAQRRIERFVRVFLERCTDVSVVVPPEMQNGPPTADGWWPWKAVDSPVRPEDVLRLEARVGGAFPPLFRAYLTYKCLLMTEFCVSLPETPFDRPLEQLEALLALRSTAFFTKRGLLPFGTDPEGAGPACFDLTCRGDDGDCPVVLVDLGRVSEPEYGGQFAFGSFAELLDCIEEELLSYSDEQG